MFSLMNSQRVNKKTADERHTVQKLQAGVVQPSDPLTSVYQAAATSPAIDTSNKGKCSWSYSWMQVILRILRNLSIRVYSSFFASISFLCASMIGPATWDG